MEKERKSLCFPPEEKSRVSRAGDFFRTAGDHARKKRGEAVQDFAGGFPPGAAHRLGREGLSVSEMQQELQRSRGVASMTGAGAIRRDAQLVDAGGHGSQKRGEGQLGHGRFQTGPAQDREETQFDAERGEHAQIDRLDLDSTALRLKQTGRGR